MPAPPRNSKSAGPKRKRSRASSSRQVPGEYLEDGPAAGRAATQGCLQHGQLVVVGQERGPRRGGPGRGKGGPGRVTGWRLMVHGIGHRWKTTEWEVGRSEHGAR